MPSGRTHAALRRRSLPLVFLLVLLIAIAPDAVVAVSKEVLIALIDALRTLIQNGGSAHG